MGTVVGRPLGAAVGTLDVTLVGKKLGDEDGKIVGAALGSTVAAGPEEALMTSYVPDDVASRGNAPDSWYRTSLEASDTPSISPSPAISICKTAEPAYLICHNQYAITNMP